MNSVSTSLRRELRPGRFLAGCSVAALSLGAVLLFAPAASAGDNVVSFHGRAATADGIVEEFLKGGQNPSAGAAGSHPMRMRGIRIQPTAPTQPAAAAGCPKTNAIVALDVKFNLNSAVLTTEAYRTLRQMAAAMHRKELATCHFSIEGHTDSTGNAAYNDVLSKKRADSVKQFLLSMDVNGRRLETVGKGSSEPLNAANPAAGENRRVQFRIIGADRN